MLVSPRVDLSIIELVYTKQHIMKVKWDLLCPCIDSYLIFVYNIVFSTGYVYLLYIFINLITCSFHCKWDPSDCFYIKCRCVIHSAFYALILQTLICNSVVGVYSLFISKTTTRLEGLCCVVMATLLHVLFADQRHQLITNYKSCSYC